MGVSLGALPATPGEGLAFAEAALEQVRPEAGEAARLFLQGEETLTWDVVEPPSGRVLESRGVFVRAVAQWMRDGRVGVAEGPVSGLASLDALFAEARARCVRGAVRPQWARVTQDEEPVVPPGALSGERARSLTLRVADAFAGLPGRFQTLLVRQSLGWVALAGSEGSRVAEWRPSEQFWVRYETGRGAVVDAAAAPSLSGELLDVAPSCARITEAMEMVAEAGGAPEDAVPWVLRPAVATPLVMGLGQLLRGDLAARSAGLARAMGRKLFPGVLSVRDVPMRRGRDDEGTPMAPLTLVEDGRLAGFLHTEETAAALGAPNAGRASWVPGTARCLPSAMGLHVAPGSSPLPPRYNELTARLETFSVLPRGGLVSLIVAGWEVREGQRVRRIGPMDLELPVLETLRRVSGVGADLAFFPALEGCGSPSLIFDSLERRTG